MENREVRMAAETTIVAFNEGAEDQARQHLLACCASSRWADYLIAGRPFASLVSILDTSDHCFDQFTATDVAEALAGHPRIGDQAEGDAADARWSRQEQSSVTDADEQVKDKLRQKNIAYEHRFDRVFLIRAAGRTPAEMLAELDRRLGNDEQAEEAEVIEQLRQVTRLRLERLFSE